ncbi:uncharacterized protein LOC112690010 [Sipha flava]|uniref:Uncharacterized protein LOC112690010 n=1 Tax=Sipha flava TaxID=143950 RepID=A0A8B8GA69_9HEMI|nr:uncharacterized protein LOC112690010 [Sipha flava]
MEKFFPNNCSTLTKTELIEKDFPNIAQNYKDHVRLSERIILIAKNVDVNETNFQIQNKIAGELMTYKSIDSVTDQDDVIDYPTEFSNSLELPGLPSHNLQLKIGSVIIMLWNIDQPRLCNGTRLAVKKLTNVIEFLNGSVKAKTFRFHGFL